MTQNILQEALALSASRPRSHCNRRRVTGSQATYVAQRGYTGRDHAAIEVIFPSGRYARHSYGIAVR
jgi:hypothetical protein